MLMAMFGMNISKPSQPSQPVHQRAPRSVARRPILLATRRFVIVLGLLALAGGCGGGCGALNPTPTIATVGGSKAGRAIDHSSQPQRIAALTQEIESLSDRISPSEAAQCADVAVRYTALLKQYHHMSSSAEWNSFMVNIGVHRRGQCFQLAADLQAELEEQHFKTLTFTRGIAYWDDWLKEHNCLVVTGPGQTFSHGLVLDPWRNPGVLRWARVAGDEYPWLPRVVATQNPSPTTRIVNLSRLAR
jgi:hypothetical protein